MDVLWRESVQVNVVGYLKGGKKVLGNYQMAVIKRVSKGFTTPGLVNYVTSGRPLNVFKTARKRGETRHFERKRKHCRKISNSSTLSPINS